MLTPPSCQLSDCYLAISLEDDDCLEDDPAIDCLQKLVALIALLILFRSNNQPLYECNLCTSS